jgi:hypothetical protein
LPAPSHYPLVDRAHREVVELFESEEAIQDAVYIGAGLVPAQAPKGRPYDCFASLAMTEATRREPR